MSDKTELTREEVDALLTGATPGPWGWIGTTPIALYSVPMQDVKHVILAPDDRCISRVNEHGQYVPLGSTSPDARLIAAAPTLARQLLATMDELTEARATLCGLWTEHDDEPGGPALSAQVSALGPGLVLPGCGDRPTTYRLRATGSISEMRALLERLNNHGGDWSAMRAADAALATMEPPDAD